VADIVPLCRPSISEAEIAAVTEALRSGWMAHGDFNHKFEHAFCKYLDVKQAVSMNSCTSALEAALAVAGVRGEVIIPSMTWVATANAVVATGGTPVFAEVDPLTRNLTADLIAARLTPRTEAVIVVHFGGQPCPMDAIVELCQRKSLLLIEDSAETLGATWRGKQAGSFAIGCFSFFPTKNITTGEGGMLTCNDAEFARKVRAICAHGVSSTTLEREKQKRPWLRAAEMVGHNYRLSNVLAAIGYHQMQRLDEMNARRMELARRYDAAIAGLGNVIEAPRITPGATHVYQMYTVTVPAAARDNIVNGMKADGIGASVHFDPPVHLQPYYQTHWHGCEGMLPATELLSRRLITLPMYPDMAIDQQDLVIASLQRMIAAHC